MEIKFKPIGIIRTKVSDADVKEKGGAEKARSRFIPNSPRVWKESTAIRICL
jgi:hypothetical protein